MGALKAAAMPAAMPTEAMRLLFTGLSRATRARKLLTPAQICTVGPSTPSDAPLPNWKAHSTNLPMVSLIVMAPKRNVYAVFTCGMPLPAAAGTQYVRPRPATSPPSAGVRIVHQIQLWPGAPVAGSMSSAYSRAQLT